MSNENSRRRTPTSIILASLALGIGLADCQSSFAKVCGEYCEAKHAQAICQDVVRKRNLKGQRAFAEFEKCKTHIFNSENSKEKAQDTRSSAGY